MKNIVRRGLAILILVSTSVWITACEDVISPISVEGTYDLVEVNGESLPTTFFNSTVDGSEVEATALDGTLELDGSRFQSVVETEFLIDGVPISNTEQGDLFLVESTGSYSVTGNEIVLEPDDQDAPTVTGTVEGDVIVTTESNAELGIPTTITLTWQR